MSYLVDEGKLSEDQELISGYFERLVSKIYIFYGKWYFYSFFFSQYCGFEIHILYFKVDISSEVFLSNLFLKLKVIFYF